MSFVKKSYQEIYRGMVEQTRQLLPELNDFEEGSVIRTLYESFAYEMAILYEQLDVVYNSGFVDTATEANLDRVVAVLGIKRNEPDYAAGVVSFVCDPSPGKSIVVPAGTMVTTVDDSRLDAPRKAYFTIEEKSLAEGESEIKVRIKAESPGRQFICDAEQIIVMPSPITGVKTVTNKEAIRFLGHEKETDVALRARAKQVLLSSGRASRLAIKNALLSCAGIHEVEIEEKFSDDDKGYGRITVFVNGLDDNNIKALREKVDQVRAAGVFVDLLPAEIIYVDLTFSAVLTGEDAEAIETIKGTLKTQLTSYFDKLAMGQPLVFSQLVKTSLEVNGIGDIELIYKDVRHYKSPDIKQSEKNKITNADKKLPCTIGQRFKLERLELKLQ
jgi:uncharacterized phage protein gp47/JayE